MMMQKHVPLSSALSSPAGHWQAAEAETLIGDTAAQPSLPQRVVLKQWVRYTQS